MFKLARDLLRLKAGDPVEIHERLNGSPRMLGRVLEVGVITLKVDDGLAVRHFYRLTGGLVGDQYQKPQTFIRLTDLKKWPTSSKNRLY